MQLAPERDPLLRILACVFPLLALLMGLLLWLLHAGGQPLPPCPMLHYFHLACPSCGGTQALIELIAGHPGTAVATNPLVTGLALLLACGGVWGIVTTAVRRWRRQLILSPRETRVAAFAAAALIGANWIYEIVVHR